MNVLSDPVLAAVQQSTVPKPGKCQRLCHYCWQGCAGYPGHQGCCACSFEHVYLHIQELNKVPAKQGKE